ncbi:type II secretion system F family protein [bacterium]|nr:type II secretion system F family protein [bacterium]
MKFRYVVQTKKGKKKEGIIDAFTLSEARMMLLEKDWIVLSLEPFEEKKRKKIRIPLFGKVSFVDKLLFTKHLGMMIKSGVPLREAVLEIRKGTRSRKFKAVLEGVIESLDNGESLARSLSRYPDVFDPLFVNLIKVGEESGTLEETFRYLAIQLEKTYSLSKKIKSAMLYPILILTATFTLIGVLALFIFPKLIPLFEGFNIELPLPTRILLWGVKTVQNYGIFVAMIILFFLGFLVFISRLRPVKSFFHHLILKLPVVRKFSRDSNLAYLARTLGTLVKSGVPIIEALDITSKTLKNIVYQDYLRKSVLSIQRGKEIGLSLAKEPKLFPSVFSRMISTGEKTGRLEEALFYLADFYESEIDDAAKNLSQVLEPVLLIMVGFLVGFVAVSIIMPIYKIAHHLSGLRR